MANLQALDNACGQSTNFIGLIECHSNISKTIAKIRTLVMFFFNEKLIRSGLNFKYDNINKYVSALEKTKEELQNIN